MMLSNSYTPHVSQVCRGVPALCIALVATGCASLTPRTPVPYGLVDSAQVLGIERARAAGDEQSPYFQQWLDTPDEEIQATHAGVMHCEHNYLAISGGGQNGAFGAGLLTGWTEAGTRPDFTIVTGISTGALTAPFAYLGPDYDHILKEIYTSYSTADIIRKRNILFALRKDAFASSDPLKEILDKYVTVALMQAIAAQHRTGRALLVGTTNLDTGRPVVWNIGRIADSGKPGALGLIRQILLASASIPAAMPPVLISVEAGGNRYDELHTDGGTSSQVFLYPSGMDWEKVADKLDVVGKPNLYIIRNAFAAPEWKVTEPALSTIADRSISSLIRTQGVGDVYRMYVSALRDNIAFHLALITESYVEKPEETFDKEYMTKLFDYAYQLSKTGYQWKETPPGFDAS